MEQFTISDGSDDEFPPEKRLEAPNYRLVKAGIATIPDMEINDNRYYYYWQWREGEKVRSQYKGPVSSDE